MESSISSLRSDTSSKSKKTVKQPFPFFELPAEIRLRIYELVLIKPLPVDLDPNNYRTIRPSLTCFFVCRRMHEEAHHVFYGSPHQSIRLFPIHGRFFHTKKPLLTRIGARNRRAVNTLDLLIGHGWSAPPRCWHTEESLGLRDCLSARTLKILITCDPSDEVFNGFRGKGNDKDSYKIFCVGILRGVFDQVPTLETVELDGYPAVSKDAPLVRGLVAEIRQAKKRLAWGPMRGWKEEVENEKRELAVLEQAMSVLGL